MKEASRKTALLLFVVRFFRLLVSVATLSISARFFGVSVERDTWIIGLNFVLVINLALWGPLNETFRAKFIFLRVDEGEERALSRASSLLVFTLIVLFFVILVLELFSLPIARLLAPSFNAADLYNLSILLRFLLFSAIINQATLLLSSILNTFDSFYVPEIAGFFSAILNFLLVFILSGHIGIYSFLIANYVSLILLLIALVYQIRKLRIPLFQSKIRLSWSEIKPFIIFSVPFFLPYIVGQFNGLLEKSLSNSIGNNAVSIIDYSKKLSDIIQAVLTSVLVSIMVPVLSSKFASESLDKVLIESKKYIQLSLLMLAFFVPFLIISSSPITEILYNKGNISASDLSEISYLIKLYAISLYAIFLYLGFGLLLLSIKKNKQYAFYGMVAQFLMIGINLFAYRFWGISTFVIALSVSHLITSILLFMKLPFDRITVIKSIVIYTMVILFTAVISFAINNHLFCPTNPYLSIVYNAVVVIFVGLILVFAFGLSEVQFIRQFIANRKLK